MPTPQTAPTGEQPDTNTPPPTSEGETSEEGDLNQGYQFTVTVSADGFQLGEPEPIEADAQEPGETPETKPETLDTPTDLVRGILALLKAHPIDGNAQSQFQAGFNGQR